VTEHEDLGVLGEQTLLVGADQLEDAARQTLEERQGHGLSSSLARLGSSSQLGE
jgi:hypothetical protein